MSMCSLTLPTWMRLLQDANRATDKWKDECSYWKHKYYLLYREYQHMLRSRLCESCRELEDGNFAPTVVNHGRGVHDSPQGLGATHSILQRRTHRKCLVEQSRHVSRQKTCVVSQPPIAPRPGQCPNQTLESRINQVNQTHPSIFRRRRCGDTGWPARRGRGRGR